MVMADSNDKATEIDSADDLFFPDVEEEAASSTVMDEDDVSVGGAEEPWEEKKKGTGLGYLTYYGIPAVGALLILSLGWTFAFIARRGLAPPGKPKQVAKSEIFEKQPLLEKPSSFSKETAKAVPKDVAVPISNPFFIPLEGGSSGSKGAKKPGPTVFLNLSVNVLVSSKAAATEFNSKRALIREEIFLHYNRLTPKDLETAEKRERIRRELIAKLGKKISQGEVKSILFQEFYTR